MAVEFYNDVKAVRAQIAAEDEARRLAEQERSNSQSTQGVRETAQAARDEEARRKEIEKQRVIAASGKMLAIFDAIQSNADEVQQAPMSAIGQTPSPVYDGVATHFNLKWGNKLALTAEEEEFIKSHYYEPVSGGSLTECPETIIAQDCDIIKANISPSIIRIGNNITLDTEQFIADPRISTRGFAEVLEHPEHLDRVMHKGRDYFRPDPNY